MNYIIMSEENATYYDLKTFCKTNFPDKIHNIDDLKNFVTQNCNIEGDILSNEPLQNKTGVIIKKIDLNNELVDIKTRVDNGQLVI